MGTPRGCPGGGSTRELGIVWKEIHFTGKFSHWEVHVGRCIATGAHHFHSRKLQLFLYSHHGNIRMTHTSSVVRVSERIYSMPRMQTESGITSFVAQGCLISSDQMV